jgi:hypothetical protein
MLLAIYLSVGEYVTTAILTSPFTCVGTQLQRAVYGNLPQTSNVLTGASKLSSAHAEATGNCWFIEKGISLWLLSIYKYIT